MRGAQCAHTFIRWLFIHEAMSLNQGVKVGTLSRQNEINSSYVRLAYTSIFGLFCVLCKSTSWNLTVTFNLILFGAQHPISISARIQWLHCPDKMQSVDWSARNIAFTIDYNYKITTIHINYYSAFIPIVDKNHWAKLHLTCGIK